MADRRFLSLVTHYSLPFMQLVVPTRHLSLITASMTPERWRQLEAVFHDAVELQEEERAAFLAKVCGSDGQLREEAERLIAAHERKSSFIEPPVLAESVELRDDNLESLLGRYIGPYHVINQLGRGGMGEVYLAEDIRLGRKIALKMLPAAFTQNPDRVSRFEREAKAASALNHPNILTIYEIGQLEGVHFIATEFVEGVTLRQRMNDAKMTFAETLEIAPQVATALAAAHGAGIVHRDVKPENVMVRPDGLVKVLDFGLAKLVGSLIPASELFSVSQTRANGLHTEFGFMMGTVRYMSPEQASGKLVDRRSDIFSFGVVLYELLTGRLPFTGASDLEILQAIIHGVPQPVGKEVPLELRVAVEKALEKDPAKRHQSMPELIAALKRVQQLRTASKFTKRRWRILALVSLILLVIASVLAWRLWEADYFWRNPLAGARTERLTDFQGEEMDAAVSPDGKLMAFLSKRDGNFDAWLSQIGSGEFANLTKGRFATLAPHVIRRVGFSGDSSRAWILEGHALGPFATWQASVTGGVPYPFLAGGMEPAWSPDGHQIVYHTAEPGDPIFIADRNGGNPRRILAERPSIHCHHLTWVSRWQLYLLREGYPDHSRDGYLANPGFHKRAALQARADYASQRERWLPGLARYAYFDLLCHGGRRVRTVALCAGYGTSDTASGEFRHYRTVSVGRRQCHPAAPALGHCGHSQCESVDCPDIRPGPKGGCRNPFHHSHCTSARAKVCLRLSSLSFFHGRQQRAVEDGGWRCQGAVER
jgi:eukaryotic-like serine/threonine-protein kinase